MILIRGLFCLRDCHLNKRGLYGYFCCDRNRGGCMARLFVLMFGLVCGVAFAAERGGGSLMYSGAYGGPYADMATAGATYRYNSLSDVTKYNCVGSGNYCVSSCTQATVSTYQCNVRDPWGANSSLGGNIVIKCADGFTATPSATNTISAVCGMSADEACGVKGDLGSSSTKWSYSGGYPGYGGGYCIGGCSYDLYGNESYDKGSNMSSATGVMKPVPGGRSCSSATTPKTDDTSVNGTNPTTAPSSSDPTPSSCQTGQVAYKGTVNGQSVTVCGAATKSTSTGTTTTDSTSNTTSNNNGTQSTSSTSGASAKTTRTTCENGQCTTTTSSTGSTGGGSGTSGGTSTSGTETKTQPQNEYCKDNPTAQVCKQSNDSSFSGTCGAFSCDGDAIQCAIVREQHRRNCQLFDERTPMTEIGEGAAGAGNRPSDHPGNNPDDIDVGARMAGVARENPFGDGCPRDFDLAVMGNVVTVPLSNACDVLKLMGDIAVAFAFIAGARIVMSGVSSGAT